MAATGINSLNPPAVDTMLTAPTYGMVHDVLRPELETVWNEHDIPYHWLAGVKRYYLPLWGNSIWLRSGDDPNHLRGPTLAAVGLDEAAYQPPMVHKIALSRARHPKARIRRVFGATTPAGFNWVYSAFVDPTRKNLARTSMVNWPTAQNRAVLDADPDFVNILRDSYTDDLFRQEALGEFLVVGKGRTYYNFQRQTHLKDFDLDPNLPLALCVDFNVAPAVWIVSQGQGTERSPERAIDEISVSGELSTLAALRVFKERYPPYASGWNVEVYGDASGQARKTTGYTDFQEIQSALPLAQVFVRHRNPFRKDRFNAVNSILMNHRGQVRAYIHSTKCPLLLRDMEQVRNKEGTFEVDKSNLELTHASDAWGYRIHWCYPVIAQGPRHVPVERFVGDQPVRYE